MGPTNDILEKVNIKVNINIKEKINYRDSKKVNGCQGLIVGGGRDE